MPDQDDLLLIHHLRAHQEGGDARELSREALANEPGRAAGRVMSWSLDRVTACLDRHARRVDCCQRSLVPSTAERRLTQVVRALARRDRMGAEETALWLVPKREVQGFLDRLAPLVEFYAAAAPGRRRAANA